MISHDPDIVIFTDVACPGVGKYAGTFRIATELRSHGFTVQVVDFFTEYTTEELKDIIRKFVTKDTLWVGLSSTFLLPFTNLINPYNINLNANINHQVAGWNAFTGFTGTGDADDPPSTNWHTGRPVTSTDVLYSGLINPPADNNTPGFHLGEGPQRMQQTWSDGSPLASGDDLSTFVGRYDWPELAVLIRKINKDCRIVLGGTKSDLFEFGKAYIDHRIIGQGEASVLWLSKMLKNDKKFKADMRIRHTYDDFTHSRLRYIDRDLIFPKENLPMEIARGCIFKCPYCSFDLNGKKLWEFNRTPSLVREDLQEAHDLYGTTGFTFADDTYNDSLDKVKRFHEEFSKLSFDMTWSSYARLDMIISNWDQAKILYDSGLRSVFFGVETLNHEAGKRIGKGMLPQKQKDGMHRLKELWPDVSVCWGMIVGLPYDTEETIRRDMEWFTEDNNPVDCVVINPLNISLMGPFGKTNDHNSLMGNNPGEYQFEMGEHSEWTSPWMTRKKAVELTNELRYTIGTDRLPSKSEYKHGLMLKRIENVGFTLEQIKDNDGPVTFDEVNKRRAKMKEQYKQKLMEL